MNALTKSLLVFLMSASVSFAAEGRTSIGGPTTITKPGHYIVTRNIHTTVGDPITIAASNVVLNLNGRTISTADPAAQVIAINNGSNLIRIEDGFLMNGKYGIHGDVSGGLTVSIDNLKIEGSVTIGINLVGAADVEMTRTTVLNTPTAVLVVGLPGTPFTGRFVGNTFSGFGYCLALSHPREVQVRDNVMTNCSLQGIQLGVPGTPPSPLGPGGNVVHGNTVSTGGTGITVATNAPGNLVLKNVLKNNAIGISVDSSANRIAENIITDSTSAAPAGGGITILQGRNLIEGNLIDGSAPGCGIRFFGAAATLNAHRNNMLRNNAGGAVCLSSGAPAQTDAGGNIL